jgi:hypothetical protein
VPQNDPTSCLTFPDTDVTAPDGNRTANTRYCGLAQFTNKIYTTDGKPWDGKSSPVQVIISGGVAVGTNGTGEAGCLENPLRGTPPINTAQAVTPEWGLCATGGGIDPQAQVFTITVNPDGSFTIVSNIESALGYTYPQPECLQMTGYGPTELGHYATGTIGFAPCTGANVNWVQQPVSCPGP